jgi:hypothetical protein
MSTISQSTDNSRALREAMRVIIDAAGTRPGLLGIKQNGLNRAILAVDIATVADMPAWCQWFGITSWKIDTYDGDTYITEMVDWRGWRVLLHASEPHPAEEVPERSDTQPNTAELVAIYQYIKTHPDEWHQFDYGRQTACGTAYCVAGWAAVRAGSVPAWLPVDASGARKFQEVTRPDGGDQWADEYAAEVLGIDLHGQAGDLFDPGNTLADIRRIITEVTGVDPESDGAA